MGNKVKIGAGAVTVIRDTGDKGPVNSGTDHDRGRGRDQEVHIPRGLVKRWVSADVAESKVKCRKFHIVREALDISGIRAVDIAKAFQVSPAAISHYTTALKLAGWLGMTLPDIGESTAVALYRLGKTKGLPKSQGEFLDAIGESSEVKIMNVDLGDEATAEMVDAYRVALDMWRQEARDAAKTARTGSAGRDPQEPTPPKSETQDSKDNKAGPVVQALDPSALVQGLAAMTSSPVWEETVPADVAKSVEAYALELVELARAAQVTQEAVEA